MQRETYFEPAPLIISRIYINKSLMLVNNLLCHNQPHTRLIAAHGTRGIKRFKYFCAFFNRNTRPAVFNADINQISVSIRSNLKPLFFTSLIRLPHQSHCLSIA